MTHIDTPSDLKTEWTGIASRLKRDLAAMDELTRDPLGTLRRLGYEIGPAAAALLLQALP